MIKRAHKHLLASALVLVVLGGVVCLRPSHKAHKGNQSATTVSNQATTTAIAAVAVYVSADELLLPDAELAALRLQIANLQRTGSTSAGVLTNEFKKSTHAKMSYRFGRRQKLSFRPVSLQSKLPDGFVLTGRQYEGDMGEHGFDGLYRLFENPTSKARLEITQTKIDKQPLLLPSELFAQVVNDTPVRLETLSDKKGVAYHHGEFVYQDSYICMTSKGMALEDFLWLINQILTV